jgi:hypothetical protein
LPAEIVTKIAKADEPWPDGPAMLNDADGIVMLVTQGARWMQTDAARYDALKRLAERKGAIVALHWSIGAQERTVHRRAACSARRDARRPAAQVSSARRKMCASPERAHPILRGITDFRIKDEFYYRLDLVPRLACVSPAARHPN